MSCRVAINQAPATDGCSIPEPLKKLIPALRVFSDLCDRTACAEHDEAYARGGTAAERIRADYRLFEVACQTVGDWWAPAVFDAVRLYGALHWGTTRGWHGGPSAWPDSVEAP